MRPYVYELTHRETGQFYIGYREANKLPSAQDIVKYQSSSKKVENLGFDNFDIRILSEFQSGVEAYDFENQEIETRINDPLCLNGHFFKEGTQRFRHNLPHTEEAKLKMKYSDEKRARTSQMMTGKKRGSYEPKSYDYVSPLKGKTNKLKGIKRGTPSDEARAKMSAAAKARCERQRLARLNSINKLKESNNGIAQDPIRVG